jgi:hypothetical protein
MKSVALPVTIIFAPSAVQTLIERAHRDLRGCDIGRHQLGTEQRRLCLQKGWVECSGRLSEFNGYVRFVLR